MIVFLTINMLPGRKQMNIYDALPGFFSVENCCRY